MNLNYLNFIKPIGDMVFSFLFIVFFGWLFLLIALVYMVTWQFPVFFFQPRLGREGVTFQMIKFRTLSTNQSQPMQQRTFWLGTVLRKTSLDEIPQVINILKGQMSWIGPRPLPIEYDTLFTKEQRIRFEVKPGITGWAQVNGRHSINWKKKFELDTHYVNHCSLKLDLLIFFKTLFLLLSLKKDNSLLEEKFTGN
jgi:undecaprenyl phosphate N,N'-diacetylbacillosamine 1-phosphate transferase